MPRAAAAERFRRDVEAGEAARGPAAATARARPGWQAIGLRAAPLAVWLIVQGQSLEAFERRYPGPPGTAGEILMAALDRLAALYAGTAPEPQPSPL